MTRSYVPARVVTGASLLIISLLSVNAQSGDMPRAKPVARFDSGKGPVQVPIDIDNNIIRMNVRINGSRPLMMVFDTGASMTGIDERLVQELSLKTSDTLKGRGTGGSLVVCIQKAPRCPSTARRSATSRSRLLR